MKIIFFFIIILTSVFSMSQKNNLVVFTLESEPFHLILNGIRQNDNPETNVKVTNLEGDFYKMRIVFDNQELEPIDQSVSHLNSGTEIKMEIEKKRGEYKVRYVGETKLSSTEKKEEEGQKKIKYSATKENSSSRLNQIETKESTRDKVEDTSSFTVSKPEVNSGKWSSQKEEGNKDGNVGIEAYDDKETDFDEYVFLPNKTMCESPNVTQNEYMDFRYAIEEINMLSREEFILAYIKDHCMTSSQVAGILNLNYSTVNNYEIAKNAYRYTWDTERYGVVINELKTESDQKRLIDFLDIDQDEEHQVSTLVNHERENEIIKEPLILDYTGHVGCFSDQLVDNADELKLKIETKGASTDKMKVIRKAADEKCFTVTQVETVSAAFTQESERLDFIQWAYNYTYDIDNYYRLFPVFVHSANKQKLGSYIMDQPLDKKPLVYGVSKAVPPVGYSGKIGSYKPLVDDELLKKVVGEQVFTKDKILVLEHALKSKAITVHQFKRIAEEFTSDKDILTFAKIAYPKIVDIDNFPEIANILNFESNKMKLDELME